MAEAGNRGLYRLALTYRLEAGGLLVADQLTAEKVPARGEGALYRRLAALADAGDDALVAAASRYGPLGPTGPIRVQDRPAYLWAADRSLRTSVRNVRLLRAWLAHGGTTPLPGRIAPVAHALAAIAEADTDGTFARLAELIAEGDAPTQLERSTFDRKVDRLEHRLYAGIGRRAAAMNRDTAHGEDTVMVHVQPTARPRLASGARHWLALMGKASEFGGLAELIPPGTLGRVATEVRPYLSEGDLPLYPVERLTEWRKACRELVGWADELAGLASAGPNGREALRATLVYRLQSVDAWPYPTDAILGTFPRALWSVWQPLTGARPRRACAWPDCTALLPEDAHGSRRLCDDHRREADRIRAARNRQRRAG